jgi:hypothetical protein
MQEPAVNGFLFDIHVGMALDVFYIYIYIVRPSIKTTNELFIVGFRFIK